MIKKICYKSLYDQFMKSLCDLINKIIYNIALEYSSFDYNGGIQFSRDIKTLCELFGKYSTYFDV